MSDVISGVTTLGAVWTTSPKIKLAVFVVLLAIGVIAVLLAAGPAHAMYCYQPGGRGTGFVCTAP
jgi:hypothetical protein